MIHVPSYTVQSVEYVKTEYLSVHGWCCRNSSNTASVGGAMGTFCGSIFIHDSNFIRNTATYTGGAIALHAVLTYVVVHLIS